MKNILFIVILMLPFSKLVLASDCIPTPHRTTGTHYEPVTNQKMDISKGLIVTGKILASPDCIPVKNAKVAHWQAGENGRYQDKLRAYLYTNDKGEFKFETEWPNITPPHIHFIINADGYETLETQWIGENRQAKIAFTIVIEEK